MNKFISGRKGFTLMEIVFVILLIALIVSFALPAFRNIRFDIKNARVKGAVLKLAEARRSFYQTTKGYDIAQGSFIGANTKTYATDTTNYPCNNPALTGVPPATSGNTVDVQQLFACGLLDWHDFVDLPYTFYICSNSGTASATAPCNDTYVYAGAVGSSEAAAGSKYYSNYWMRVYSRQKTKSGGGFYPANSVVDSED